MNFVLYFWNKKDGEKISVQVKKFYLRSEDKANITVAILNISLFYWGFLILSDCRHLNMREIDNFPTGIDKIKPEIKIS